MKKLFVAVPVHRELPVDFAMCWLKLAQARDLPFKVRVTSCKGKVSLAARGICLRLSF